MHLGLGSLLLPGSDTAALIEALVTAAVTAAGVALSWRQPEWRLLAIGITVCVFAFMALRAVH